MKNIILSLAILISPLAFTQNYLMPKVPSIQSPNIYNLGLYGIYPVDFSTGVPKIEIPIYTIKSGSLTFPITISYHASGIKVNQEASAVGLGWSLNAGGAIIRTLKDRPDELSTGFLSKGNSIPFYNSLAMRRACTRPRLFLLFSSNSNSI